MMLLCHSIDRCYIALPCTDNALLDSHLRGAQCIVALHMLVYKGSSHGVRLAGACSHIAVVGLLCIKASHSLSRKLFPGSFVCLKKL